MLLSLTLPPHRPRPSRQVVILSRCSTSHPPCLSYRCHRLYEHIFVCNCHVIETISIDLCIHRLSHWPTAVCRSALDDNSWSVLSTLTCCTVYFHSKDLLAQFLDPGRSFFSNTHNYIGKSRSFTCKHLRRWPAQVSQQCHTRRGKREVLVPYTALTSQDLRRSFIKANTSAQPSWSRDAPQNKSRSRGQEIQGSFEFVKAASFVRREIRVASWC
jgi:hypothetical protein